MTDIKPQEGFTCLPASIRILIKALTDVWRHRHQPGCCWLIIMQMVTSRAKTLASLL
ncbi:MAG: hypothetical protein PHW74_02930 [Desulfobacca sp.]|nr:hypothetical protein [Desulfobacca sp.]